MIGLHSAPSPGRAATDDRWLAEGTRTLCVCAHAASISNRFLAADAGYRRTERRNRCRNGREHPMSSNTDDLKGRVKEAAGAVTDDNDLRKEGKRDQAGAKVKEFAEDAKDAV